MPQNKQHYDTFKILLDEYGLPQFLLEEICFHLSYINNDKQDELIKLLILEQRKKRLSEKEAV